MYLRKPTCVFHLEIALNPSEIPIVQVSFLYIASVNCKMATTLNKYLALESHGRVQAMYVWIDGTGETMRCKTKTLDSAPKSAEDLPIWNFDGSSCKQAEGHNSDVYLYPRRLYKDPFRGGENVLVLCETWTHDKKPANTNHRVTCNEAMEAAKVYAPPLPRNIQ